METSPSLVCEVFVEGIKACLFKGADVDCLHVELLHDGKADCSDAHKDCKEYAYAFTNVSAKEYVCNHIARIAVLDDVHDDQHCPFVEEEFHFACGHKGLHKGKDFGVSPEDDAHGGGYQDEIGDVS